MKTIVEAKVSKKDERILRNIDDNEIARQLKNFSLRNTLNKPLTTP
jgi:hypothetical protein